jgi:hypothetical protein
VTLERIDGWVREVDVDFVDGSGSRVRRHQPEEVIRASKCALDDIGVAVRALDHVDAVAHALGKLLAIGLMTKKKRPGLATIYMTGSFDAEKSPS